MKIYKRNCDFCKEIYTGEGKKYCSNICSSLASKGRIVSVETRKKLSDRLKGRKRPPFSIEARKNMSEAQKGRKHTIQTIEKMKKSATGIKRPWSKKSAENMTNINKGKKRPPFSKQWKENIGKSKRGKKLNISQEERERRRVSRLGSNNPLWKNGITTLNVLIRNCSNYANWRINVFIRDNFTCKKCGDNKGGNLEAHHIKAISLIIKENNIKNYNESLYCNELWDINNGETLCIPCHKKTNNYGRKNTKK